MKNILTSLVLLLCVSGLWAQVEPNSSLYVFNMLPYNPATTAQDGQTSMTATYRNQWTQIEDAPQTIHFNAQLPFAGKNGFGIAFTNDKLGLTSNNSLMATYAYRMKITENLNLNVGLSGTLDMMRVNWQDARAVHVDDLAYPNAAANLTGMNFGVGAQLMADKWFFGVAMPRMMANAMHSDEWVAQNGNSIARTLYATGGLKLPLSDNISLQPTAMLISNSAAPIEAELSVQAVFANKFGLGVNHRLDESVDVFMQYKIGERMRLGASYDFTTNKLKSYNNGSFDVMLRYVLPTGSSAAFEDVRFF